MTRPTYSTDKFIAVIESWDTPETQECFPKKGYCPFDYEGEDMTLMCVQCPFSEPNRKQFLNTLKTIKLLELDHVAIPKTPETDEGGE